MHIRRDLRSFDFVLFILVVVLSIFGTFMVGSATGLGAGNFSSIFINQIFFLVSGIGIMLLCAFVDYELIAKFYILIYFINIALLTIVLFIHQDAIVARWLGVEIGGILFGIQPSEFTKIFMIIFLAKIIDKYKEKINNILVLSLIIISTVIPIILIYLQPSLSASMVTIVILLTMLYLGKISYKYIISSIALLAPALLFFYIDLHAETPVIIDQLLEPWQIERIWYMLYPQYDTEYNVWQNQRALSALSAGLLTGRGVFNNPFYIPEQSNDFIFSVIGAELGFIGASLLIAIVLAISLRCFIIAHRSDVFLGRLLAGGVGVTIAFQAFVHVAINTWLLPNTGINFPFVSSGGSSMWIFMAGIGFVLNVAMTRNKSLFEE